VPIDTFDRFDAHVHVGRWQLPDFGGHGSDLDDVSGVLSATGFTGALVMPTDAGDNAGTLAALDAYRGPLSFLFAPWIDPRDASLPAFLDANAGRIAALKFHPSFCRLPLTAPEFRPFLQHAADRGLPCVVHCGRWQEVAGWSITLQVVESLPRVPFILSHMGGDSPGLVAGAAAAIHERHLDNAYLGTESIREPWVVGRALAVLGSERLVFGSDHNLNHPGSFLAVIEALGLSAAQRAAILGGNARRILALHAGSH
jgi:predicted TIM-barrel fold metal-dependent hydrolase